MKKKREAKTSAEETLEDFSLDDEKSNEEQTETEQEQTQENSEDEIANEECECEECKNCNGNCSCEEKQSGEAEQYLQLAQRLQADFDNYRKRVTEQLEKERQEGIKSVIEVFLPSLDAFSEAKKSIENEIVLSGINMIENKIINALDTLKVKKILTVGEKFNPYLHNVIAVMEDKSKENDEILQEYQSGWTLNGKVIRYAKVIVNKKGE